MVIHVWWQVMTGTYAEPGHRKYIYVIRPQWVLTTSQIKLLYIDWLIDHFYCVMFWKAWDAYKSKMYEIIKGYNECTTTKMAITKVQSIDPLTIYVYVYYMIRYMMTSSNGNLFRVTDPLCGEFTGEFPALRPVTRSFDVFFDLRLNKRLSKQSWGWWFYTPSRPVWRHCNENSNYNCSKPTGN